MGSSALAAVDAASFRYVMGHYPTGVVVVTAMVDGAPVGMVLGTFSSVSLDPPLVSFMPTRTSNTWAVLDRATEYVINVLAHDQQEVCLAMARRDPDKFDKVAWSPSPVNGAPVLEGAVSVVVCTPDQKIDAGDHLIVLCAVQHVEVRRQANPLLFFQGGYGSFSAHSMLARVETSLVPKVMRAQVGQAEMDALAEQLDCESAILVEVSEDEMVTAATAYGPSGVVVERLGEIIPITPPVGDLYVAFEHADAQERWVQKALTKDEVIRDIYRDRLALARRRRWSMSLTTPEDRDTYENVIRHVQEYSRGDLTPSRRQELQAEVEQASHLYAVTEIREDADYFVGSIVAPLTEPDGSVRMVLRISQLPAPATGAQVRAWQEALSQTAETITDLLAENCQGS